MSATRVPNMNTISRRIICSHGARKPDRIATAQLPARLLAVLLTTFVGTLAAQDAATPSPDAAGSVEVTVENIASTNGLIYASLFTSADGFPNAREQAVANRSVPASESTNGTLLLTFTEIPAGMFAISIMHDANANGILDTNFMGIPSEDYGFSQNPNSLFGPPSFEKAAVTLTAGEIKQLAIKLK